MICPKRAAEPAGRHDIAAMQLCFNRSTNEPSMIQSFSAERTFMIRLLAASAVSSDEQVPALRNFCRADLEIAVSDSANACAARPGFEACHCSERLGMTYFEHGASPGKEDAVSTKVSTREEALQIAAKWREDGYSGIRIVADGRIYTPGELALIIINDE
jgi:hypothetical protein